MNSMSWEIKSLYLEILVKKIILVTFPFIGPIFNPCIVLKEVPIPVSFKSLYKTKFSGARDACALPKFVSAPHIYYHNINSDNLSLLV